jgi:hypothetical protein
VELAFLTPLLKNSAESVGRGVAIDDKGFLKTWLLEDGGGAYRVNEGVKRGFVFILPVKSASFGAVGNECIKWGGEHAEIANIHAIEVEKSEKGL